MDDAPRPKLPPTIPPGEDGDDDDSATARSRDPNALYGPSGYGTENYVTNLGSVFDYRITFENFATATAPAQMVRITNQLDPRFDWSSFLLTGIGFADNNLVIPPGKQQFEETISMTYNGQTFDVLMEAGIHSSTGVVYANFYSIDPDTELPPANVLTGFLPPEDGTGRGMGFVSYSVSPKATLTTGEVIPNIASIVFDANEAITTDQVDPLDPSKGTDPAKRARVTIDATIPSAQINSLPATVTPDFTVSWRNTGGSGGSGLAGYTVYVSSNGGTSYSAWLTNTTKTSAIYRGQSGKTYSFYVLARSNVGNIQQTSTVVSTLAKTPVVVNGFDEFLNFDDNKLPQGWAINVSPDQLANSGVANKRFEARMTNTYSGLYRAKQLPVKASSFEIEYAGNISANNLGQGTQIRLYLTDGSRIGTYLGKASDGTATIYAEAGGEEAPEYQKTFNLSTGTYAIKAIFEDDKITYSATKSGSTTPLFKSVVVVPKLSVHKLQMIELTASTSASEPSWIDNVRIKAIVPVTYTIKATPSPATKGKVTGGKIYKKGAKVTLTAKPKKGIKFVGWTENNKVVSKKLVYSFTANRNRKLVAKFK